MKLVPVILAGVALATGGNVSAQLINTVPSWDYSTGIYLDGGDFATLGQTFTVDAPYTQLDAYLFALRNTARTNMTFGIYLAEWDAAAARVTGPLLYSSTATLPAAATSYVNLSASTGGIPLVAGLDYVLFLSLSPFLSGDSVGAQLAFVDDNVYSGGGAVGARNGDDFDALDDKPWITGAEDTAFILAFSTASTPVPEPSTYALLGSAVLLGLAGFRRRWDRNRR